MADAGLSLFNRVNHSGGAVIGSSKGGVLSLLAAHARWLATGTGLDGAIARANPARPARLVAQHCRIVGPDPATACRPFVKYRTGFVVGEGAAVLVLECRSHAQARGAPTKAVLASWAIRADPTSLVGLHPKGHPLAALTRQILIKTRLQPHHMHYINAHGTATKANDIAETLA